MNDHSSGSAVADPTIHLAALGWNAGIEAALEGELRLGHKPGRVIETQRGRATISLGTEHLHVPSDGTLVVGDWVCLTAGGDPRFVATAPRTTMLQRQAGDGSSNVQAIAANVDLVIAVAPLDVPVNIRRLERMLVLAWDAGADPVVVLTKADVAAEGLTEALAAARSVSAGAPVLPVSALDGTGAGPLRELLRPARTGVLFGPSGAGKSTLVNLLLGEASQVVQQVRGDGKGRHTTSSSRLLRLPRGGMLVDTPGVRGVGLSPGSSGAGISAIFGDLEHLATTCRFSDCAHEIDAGCAIQSAIAKGQLDEGRLRAWRKLGREQLRAAAALDERLARKVRADRRRKYSQYERQRRRGDYGPSR